MKTSTLKRRVLPLCWAMLVADTAGAQTAALQVSASSMSFNAVANGPKPPVQAFTVLAQDGSAIDFALLVDAGAAGSAAPSWLTVTPKLATTPAQIRVSIDQAGLASGTYSGRIQLTDRQGRLLGFMLAVTTQVTTATARLSITPPALTFAGSVFAGNLQQGILVQNLGPGPIAPVTVAVVTGFPWLRASVISCDSVCVISVGAVIGSLSPGAHNGILRITTALGTQDVPVSLFAADHGPYIKATQDALQFEAIQASGFTDSRTVSLINVGDSTATWTATVIMGGQWLSVSPSTGSTLSGKATPLSIGLTVGSLTPGAYAGLVRISSDDVASGLLDLPVALKVTASGANPTPILSTGGVFFSARAGADSVQQQVTLSAASASAISFQSAPQSSGWLSMAPSVRQVSSPLPSQLAVSAAAANLAVGFYPGLLNLAFGTKSMRGLHAGFGVTPPEGAKCAPEALYLTETAIPEGFSATVAGPVPLDAVLVDDCGNLISNSIVIATFSNGDPGLVLQPTGNGHYVQTWTPRKASDSLPGGTVSVVLQAFAPPLRAASGDVIGTVSADTTPIIFSSGVLNNLNAQVGAPVAPGAVVQIFGAGFGTATSQGAITAGRLSTNLGGVSVKIGGIDAPLYFSSPGQINAQIPSGLAVNRRYQVIVNVNGINSRAEPITTTAVQPGLASFPDGKIIAQDLNFQLITAEHPAHAGDYVILYLTGMGVTNPPVPTGVPAPRSPLATTANPPLVTIDGATSDVFFSGLSPDSVGLYQVVVRVPSDAKPGDLALVVSQLGVLSNTATLPVR